MADDEEDDEEIDLKEVFNKIKNKFTKKKIWNCHQYQWKYQQFLECWVEHLFLSCSKYSH